MRLTNRLGLPRSIENAVRNDPYTRGDSHISVTGLIAPARQRALIMKHSDEITEDVSDRIWSLLGQVTHGILERADDQAWCEERLYIERDGWRISGQFDRCVLEERRLQDYKLSNVFAIKDGCKLEWEAQQNIYRLMLQEHGYDIDVLEVVAILRDWRKRQAKYSADYPQTQCIVISVPVWPYTRTEEYIKSRLIAHEKAQNCDLPECTAEERWERPSKWAVYNGAAKRATSLHDTEAEATLAALIRGGNYHVLERAAEQIRCADYCAALPFCTFGKSLLKRDEEILL